MKKMPPIEEAFKAVSEKARIEPQIDSWDRISKEIHPKNRRKRLPLYPVIAAASVLIIVLIPNLSKNDSAPKQENGITVETHNSIHKKEKQEEESYEQYLKIQQNYLLEIDEKIVKQKVDIKEKTIETLDPLKSEIVKLQKESKSPNPLKTNDYKPLDNPARDINLQIKQKSQALKETEYEEIKTLSHEPKPIEAITIKQKNNFEEIHALDLNSENIIVNHFDSNQIKNQTVKKRKNAQKIPALIKGNTNSVSEHISVENDGIVFFGGAVNYDLKMNKNGILIFRTQNRKFPKTIQFGLQQNQENFQYSRGKPTIESRTLIDIIKQNEMAILNNLKQFRKS